MKFAPLITAAALLALPVTASAVTLSSQSPDVLVSAPDQMTDNPRGILEENACFPRNLDFTQSAQLLVNGDWIITGEVLFEGFELVSYAEGATELADGRCEFEDGRISVWQDGAFLGQFETANPDLRTIGYIFSNEEGEVSVRDGKPDPAPAGMIRYDRATEELYYLPPTAR